MESGQKALRQQVSPRGCGLYKLRSQTVESVFGQIKSGRAKVCFLRRGLQAVRSEWRLICRFI